MILNFVTLFQNLHSIKPAETEEAGINIWHTSINTLLSQYVQIELDRYQDAVFNSEQPSFLPGVLDKLEEMRIGVLPLPDWVLLTSEHGGEVDFTYLFRTFVEEHQTYKT